MPTILFNATDYFNKKKLKNPVGRPTVMDKTVLAKLEDAFIIGLSDRKACAYAGINPSSLYDYQKLHPEYTERKEALKLRPDIKAQQTVVLSLGDPLNAWKWLERKDPDFRPSSKLEHSGKIETERVLVTPDVQEAIKQYEEIRRKQIQDEADKIL